MIEDALDLSRLENNKFQLIKDFFDIRATLKEVIEIMIFQFQQKSIELKMIITNNVPMKIYCDLKRFKQVLFNLLGNAVKFTFKGFVKVNIDFNYETEILTGTVEDSGIGIKEEDLDKLFKFFGCVMKSKNVNRGGMGLGLTISKMII